MIRTNHLIDTDKLPLRAIVALRIIVVRTPPILPISRIMLVRPFLLRCPPVDADTRLVGETFVAALPALVLVPSATAVNERCCPRCG